jgi:glycosyltransferase involved in cell wall biosynthesis
MKILFIGPLPDPITGHSLACKIFLEELIKHHQVEVVNLSKDSFKEGMYFKRIIEVVKILQEVWRKKKNVDVVYLTISQSFAGNIKDLFIYLICFRMLSKMYIHLHGGSLKKFMFDKSRLLFCVNKFFISRLGAVIVLGATHVNVFTGLISSEKIHIVPNFSEDYLFTTEAEIINKFEDTQPLRILFLSNFIQGKGFDEIINAYMDLSEDLKKRVIIDFAGAFESDTQRMTFLSRIYRFAQIHYHGIVEGDKKKDLLSCAHIFCLPTCLYEGQPISILEAYASGCVVITTAQGGIPDVFRDNVNGIEVEVKSIKSLKQALEQCILSSHKLMSIAMLNFNTALQKYRMSNHNSSLIGIIHASSKKDSRLPRN